MVVERSVELYTYSIDNSTTRTFSAILIPQNTPRKDFPQVKFRKNAPFRNSAFRKVHLHNQYKLTRMVISNLSRLFPL